MGLMLDPCQVFTPKSGDGSRGKKEIMFSKET